MTRLPRRGTLGALQDGIYLEPGVPPPPAWRAVFIDVAAETAPTVAGAAVARVMAMLADLAAGRMRDLRGVRPGEADETFASGTVAALLAYGASFFDGAVHAPPLTAHPRPRHLVSVANPEAFPAFRWSPHVSGHRGEADLLIQLTGTGPHAVDRAAVEIWKLISDEALPLTIAGSFSGSKRDDRRSWIGFHDGLTNIEPSERLAAVEAAGDPGWLRGGTTLALLRLAVDLSGWRGLTRAEQELIVGRDKLSGEPIVAVDRSGKAFVPRSATQSGETCPASWRTRDTYLNPPETGDDLLEASHIHRVNQSRGTGSSSAARRIFRQGYEFLDDLSHQGPRLGLNFVSFQRDLSVFRDVLGLAGWLGDVNFGGPVAPKEGDPPPFILATLLAAGLYAAPARARPFAGAELFG